MPRTSALYRKFSLCLACTLLLASLLAPLTLGKAAPALQTPSPQNNAIALLSKMTPEERVGQLFLVTFNGPEAGAGSATGAQIYDLIVNYHIGGVILTAKNDNFLGLDRTIPLTVSLIDQLQRNEYAASQQIQTNPVTGETFQPVYVPLFVGISQEGDGYPYDQILSGLTRLPSQMSIGATWQPELARQVGSVLGKELSILGFNLLLGPSLDVLEVPYSESGGDLGVRVFGGDPFWVGEMGRAFIKGVHQGSNGQIAVVAKHFPGFGGSDRLPEEEVATVRKSLEQLKQIELYPFFVVTGNAPDTESTTDALLVSHIRYQGFQGNVRATTRPISFDRQAFLQLMNLPEFASWRQAGGLTISDNLGSRAVRRFYDPTGQAFDGRFVARDAFLAGNDLLYLGDFQSSTDPNAHATIINTLVFFAQKYREDATFAERVDEAVLRILSLKYRLYGNAFSLMNVLPEENRLGEIGRSGQTTFDVARQAATLISPSLAELDDAIPDPPGRNDQIVFITDARVYQQCSICRQDYTIQVAALENAVIRLYSGGGQILPGNLVSYSFDELYNLLQTGTGILQIENDLRQAEWIVFAMGTIASDRPSSQALRRFLDQRPDLYQQKRLIVFALGTPYNLDATDISKITAYYGLYSRSERFIEIAARLLFQELQPPGALPVSVPGAGYDLYSALLPDASQVLQIMVDLPETSALTQTPGAGLTPIMYRIGDTVPLRTAVILDQNGHPVPDGTPVRFIVTRNGEGTILQQIESQTAQGIAKAVLRFDQAGIINIRVESEPAFSSNLLSFEIPPENITPTPPPSTETPTATPSATQEPTFTPIPTVTLPVIAPTPEPIPPKTVVGFGDWLAALVASCLVGVASFIISRPRLSLRWSLRAGFLSLIGGLTAYSYLALGWPGSQALIQEAGTWGITGTALVGAILGSLASLLWRLSATRLPTS